MILVLMLILMQNSLAIFMFKPYIEGAINSHNRNGYWDYDSDSY